MNAATILAQKGGDVVTVTTDLSVEAVARTLGEKKVGAAVVLDAAGAIAGVVSERDITREVGAAGAGALGKTAGDVMTSPVITASPSDSYVALLSLMTDRRIRHLPVLDDGRMVGLVSIGDVVKRRIEAAEAEAAAMKDYIASS